MTGDEHYRRAETVLEKAGKALQEAIDHPGFPAVSIAEIGAATSLAQAHATLALAAATADAALCADEATNRYAPSPDDPDRRALGYGR